MQKIYINGVFVLKTLLSMFLLKSDFRVLIVDLFGSFFIQIQIQIQVLPPRHSPFLTKIER